MSRTRTKIKTKCSEFVKTIKLQVRKRELPICGEKIRNISRSSDARAKSDAHRFVAIERLGEQRDRLRRWQRGTERHRFDLNRSLSLWNSRMGEDWGGWWNSIWGWRAVFPFLMWTVWWSRRESNGKNVKSKRTRQKQGNLVKIHLRVETRAYKVREPRARALPVSMRPSSPSPQFLAAAAATTDAIMYSRATVSFPRLFGFR